MSSQYLKPFRQYNEQFVLNGLFALSGTGTRGSLLQMVSFSGDTPVVYNNSLAVGINGVYSYRPAVPSKVVPAASGAYGDLLGMQLYDVLEFNPTDGRLLIYSDYSRRAELQCVISGEAVPIVTKGFFEVVGYDTSAGQPGPGSGLQVSNSGGGYMAVGPKSLTQAQGRIGTFLSPSGYDGGALIYLDM